MTANPFLNEGLTSSSHAASVQTGVPAADVHSISFDWGKEAGKSDVAQPDMQAAVEGAQPLEVEARTDGAVAQPDDSGTASWPEAAYHTVTAVVGAGVLGLPYAFSKLGWAGGVLFLLVAMLASLYTSWLLASLHVYNGVRQNRYRDLGRAVLGKRGSQFFIAPFQFAVMVGLGIAYTLTGAQSMQLVEILYGDENASLTKHVFIFSAIEIGLSQIPDFGNLWWVSIIGALMSAMYSILAGALSLAADTSSGPDALVVPEEILPTSLSNNVLTEVFVPMGQIMFAYGGHSVLLEIQATLRTPPPPRVNMMKGVYVAYVVSGLCYYWVACAGFAAYGDAVAEDVLLSEPRPPSAAIAAANIMVVLHVLAGYQVYSQPVFEAVETGLERRFPRTFEPASRAAFWTRVVWRSAYALATGFVAACLPFFGDLMGLIGAIGFTPMTYVMPSVLWLVAMKERPLWERALNWTIAIVFSIIGVLAFIGAAGAVADKSSNYSTFS